jgi:hypothetical protein
LAQAPCQSWPGTRRQPGHIDGRKIRRRGSQKRNAGSDALLGPLQAGQEYEILVANLLLDQVGARRGLRQRRLYDFFPHQEQLARLLLQQLYRQGGAPLAGRLQEDMA